jgi:exopolysaccharide production protein ExoZ
MEKKLEGIQVARAIAALSVAYFHSYIALRAFPESAQMPIPPLKQWGYLGVNFFFAISGYVICLIALLSRRCRSRSNDCSGCTQSTGLRWPA